jgi:hypothetical protein
MKTFLLRYSRLMLIGLWLVGCKSNQGDITETPTPQTIADIDGTVLLSWNDTYLELDRYAPGYRPPVAARTLGYIGLAVYEASIAGSAKYQSIAKSYIGLAIPKVPVGQTINYEVAANTVYYRLLQKFFPHVSENHKKLIEQTQQKNAERFLTISQAQIQQSYAYGEAVADAVFAWSATDGFGHEGYLKNTPADYTPPATVGKWQPTAPNFSKALLPYWGKARTFAITQQEKVAKVPLDYSANFASPLYTQALEVYSTTTQPSVDGQWIAQFWSDDIAELTFEPAARWLAIGQQVMKQKKSNLETAVVFLAKIGLSLNDASVAAWHSKYIYNVERPIAYIQRNINRAWRTTLNDPIRKQQGISPNFPSYPSGHAAFGAAAAEVLTDVFGNNFSLVDRCHEARTEFNGKPRSFGSFYEMANENAYSRIPLGVHYRMDCDEGLRMGTLVGKKVLALSWKK